MEHLTADQVGCAKELHTYKVEVSKVVPLALAHEHSNVHAFARLLWVEDRYLNAVPVYIVNLFGVIDNTGCEVTPCLIELPDPIRVFVELCRVVRSRE